MLSHPPFPSPRAGLQLGALHGGPQCHLARDAGGRQGSSSRGRGQGRAGRARRDDQGEACARHVGLGSPGAATVEKSIAQSARQRQGKRQCQPLGMGTRPPSPPGGANMELVRAAPASSAGSKRPPSQLPRQPGEWRATSARSAPTSRAPPCSRSYASRVPSASAWRTPAARRTSSLSGPTLARFRRPASLPAHQTRLHAPGPPGSPSNKR